MYFKERNKYQDLEPVDYKKPFQKCLACISILFCILCFCSIIIIFGLVTTFYLYPRDVSTKYSGLIINSFSVDVVPISLSFYFRVDLLTKNDNYFPIDLTKISMNITYKKDKIGILTDNTRKTLISRYTSPHSCNLIFTNRDSSLGTTLKLIIEDLKSFGYVKLDFNGEVEVNIFGKSIGLNVNFTHNVEIT